MAMDRISEGAMKGVRAVWTAAKAISKAGYSAAKYATIITGLITATDSIYFGATGPFTQWIVRRNGYPDTEKFLRDAQMFGFGVKNDVQVLLVDKWTWAVMWATKELMDIAFPPKAPSTPPKPPTLAPETSGWSQFWNGFTGNVGPTPAPTPTPVKPTPPTPKATEEKSWYELWK